MSRPETGRWSRELTQSARLVCAIGYVVFLLICALFLDGHPPQPDLSGLWFTAGALALVLGLLLTEPFFTRPVDALITGAAVWLTAWQTSVIGAAIPIDDVGRGQGAFAIYGIALMLVSGGAILLKDAVGRLGLAPRVLAWVAARAGRSVFVFTAVYLAALYAAFADRPERIVWGVVIWLVIVGLRPLEGLIRLVRFRRPDRVAITESLEDPGTVVFRLASGQGVDVGPAVSWGNDAWGTVVDRTLIRVQALVRVALDAPTALRVGQAVRLEFAETRRDVVGYVGVGTSITELRVRAVPGVKAGLRERRLVYPAGPGEPVYYLTTSAKVIEDREGDALEERIEIAAAKVGRWIDASQSFEADQWLPDPGAPVRLHVADTAPVVNPAWVGRIPGTNFGVPIFISDAVTHNTAILGILGAGKTTLAYQLIRRMIVEGVHVVVLDISRRYSAQFRDILSPDAELRVIKHISDNAKQPGLIPNVLDRFIGAEARLLVLDPSRLVAANRNSTPASITREVAEALLALAQRDNPDEDPKAAKYCLVLEEAHTLVPEWTSRVDDDERGSVNGCARALLQGRKYGLGCVVITQRTANVAKSILNQCNTVFAMRMYDDTGIDFLKNYIGSEYAGILPTLMQQEAIAFGSAIRNASDARTVPIPLLVEVYDDGQFKSKFWEPVSDGLPKMDRAAREASDGSPTSPLSDLGSVGERAPDGI